MSPVSVLINNTSHRQQTQCGAHVPPLHAPPPSTLQQNCTHVDSFCLIIQSRRSLHLTDSLPPSLPFIPSSSILSSLHRPNFSHVCLGGRPWFACCARPHFPVRILTLSPSLSLGSVWYVGEQLTCHLTQPINVNRLSLFCVTSIL